MDPRKAADVDLETIFRVALTALEDLCELDASLAEFREVRCPYEGTPNQEASKRSSPQTLFSEDSKGLERELQAKEVNDRIDANVARYLRQVRGAEVPVLRRRAT
jgi:outer membrane translocation and assembly module TamA